MSPTLETLLLRLRDGHAVAGDLERARELVRTDARVPEELRELALVDPAEAADDAAGLLAVLGADDLGAVLAEAIASEGGAHVRDLPADDDWEAIAHTLREGLRAEAAGVELAEAVMRRLGEPAFPWGALVADAVTAEAGGATIADAVMRDVGLPAEPRLADAVLAEAGAVDVADGVMAALAIERALPIAEAVRAEAGTVDLVDRVVEVIGARPAAATAVAEVPPTPRPANDFRGFGFALVALAAAVLLTIVANRLATPVPGALTAPEALLFAQAGDVVVEDLSYGDDVVVIQTEGEQGAVILWVEEGA